MKSVLKGDIWLIDICYCFESRFYSLPLFFMLVCRKMTERTFKINGKSLIIVLTLYSVYAIINSEGKKLKQIKN